MAKSSTWLRRSSTMWCAHIRGPRGTKVRLIVQPDGTKEKRVYEITREKIELTEQHAKSKIIDSKAPDGKGVEDRHHQPAGLLR